MEMDNNDRTMLDLELELDHGVTYQTTNKKNRNNNNTRSTGKGKKFDRRI